MRILNYGAGAVGLGLDSCLIKSGQIVDIVARENTVSALKRYGLKRTGIFGNFYAPPNAFSCRTLKLTKDIAPMDYLIRPHSKPATCGISAAKCRPGRFGQAGLRIFRKKATLGVSIPANGSG